MNKIDIGMMKKKHILMVQQIEIPFYLAKIKTLKYIFIMDTFQRSHCTAL